MQTKKQINISEEERNWVKMLAEGKSTKDTAKEFNMIAGTFAYKLNILRSKLDCNNMAALIAYFIRNKLIE